MIPFFALPILALLLVAFAAGVAAWRRVGTVLALRQAGTAGLVAAVGVGVAVGAYTLGQSPEARLFRDLGAVALFLTPLACAVALRLRHGHPTVRAALAGGMVALAVFGWLVLSLRGPGAWAAGGALLTAAAAGVALVAAVCGAAWTRRGAAVLAGVVLAAGLAAADGGDEGVLVVEVRDGGTGEALAARLEILDAEGESWVPEGALPIVGDCGMLPLHNWLPALAPLQVRARVRRSLANPYRGTEQFYADGEVRARLPAGRYEVRAEHGPEYGVAERRVRVVAGETERVRLAPARWIDLPAEGWYSADDHLHIPRPDRSFDGMIARWMAAEDLWVANLLQMGLARDVHITPQHGFGATGAHPHGGGLLVSGQENPRTHILGHSIVLGAPRWIDFPGEYLLYPRFWRESHRLGGVNGLAHFALAGAEKALALWGDGGFLEFLEVGNFGLGIYERWYEALNLGLRLAPTAGSDFPCVPGLPGRDRFYARVEGTLELEGWLEAVRQGRTSVGNGPFVELAVEGAGVGAEVRLAAPRSVRIAGRVRFDPARDQVTALEMVERGAVIHRAGPGDRPGEISFELPWPVERSTWLALRAQGSKVGEVVPTGLDLLAAALDHPPPPPGAAQPRPALPAPGDPAPTVAHTGAIWITVEGSPPLAAQPAAAVAAARWRERLADLEHWLSEDAPAGVVGFPGRGDGVPEELLEAHRARLRAALKEARGWLAAIEVAPSSGSADQREGAAAAASSQRQPEPTQEDDELVGWLRQAYDAAG